MTNNPNKRQNFKEVMKRKNNHGIQPHNDSSAKKSILKYSFY